jgi:hypothetical protein
MSPRPAKHALKGARVRARLARCASESTALGRAGSYVGGTFKSLWRLAKLVRKDYTQALPGQLAPHARTALRGMRCIHARRGSCTAVAPARAREALLGGASPAARPAAGRRGCTCGRAGAARACAATRALRERRRSSSSARTASAAPARQESSQSPVCTSACMRE